MTFTRRHFILTGSVVASAAYLSAGQPGVARAEGGLLAISPLIEPARSIDVPGKGFASLTTLPFPSGFKVTTTTGPLPAFLLAVSFDNRIFEAGNLLIISDDEVSTTAQAGSPTVVGPVTTAHFDVPSSASASSSDLFLPLTARSLYPAEAIDSPRPTAVELLPESGAGASASWTPLKVLDGTTAWGAEIAVVWTDTEVLSPTRPLIYRHPQIVTITSVGPGAIPAGAEVVVDVDPRLVTDVQFSSIKRDAVALPADAFVSTSIEDQGSRRLSFVFKSTIPANSVVEIEVACTKPEEVPVVTGLLWATARISASGGDLSFQRSTGLYEVVDLTDSGAPLIEGVAKGTV